MTSPSDMTPEEIDAWDEREDMLVRRLIPSYKQVDEESRSSST